jgi:branched-chain amino acid transport system substrate-binding protein
MIKSIKIGALAVAGALALAACGGGSSSGGGAALVIGSDLPLQGASADASASSNDAIKLFLEQIGGKAGDYTVSLKEYDDSTAAKGAWDDAQCAKNAQEHVANAAEVAVMGTYNSGCAKIILPVLNQDPTGPMLMVSHANTNPGLTVAWDPGEPEKYYPTGAKNYARIIPHDVFQGSAAAQFAFTDRGVKSCAVLDDAQTYGQGVARAFEDEFKAQGGTVVLHESWDAKQSDYTSLMQKIKSAGADCLYLGGIYDNNGGTLVKNAVAVLGDNASFFKMAPDGFSGYPDLQAMPEAEGLYMSFAGKSLDAMLKDSGKGGEFVKAYQTKYGKDPVSSYAIYAAAAVQFITKAIAASDGTRKGVTDAVFAGEKLCVTDEESITGVGYCIDPATGDTDRLGLTIQLMTGGKETDLMPWEVK